MSTKLGTYKVKSRRTRSLSIFYSISLYIFSYWAKLLQLYIDSDINYLICITVVNCDQQSPILFFSNLGRILIFPNSCLGGCPKFCKLQNIFRWMMNIYSHDKHASDVFSAQFLTIAADHIRPGLWLDKEYFASRRDKERATIFHAFEPAHVTYLPLLLQHSLLWTCFNLLKWSLVCGEQAGTNLYNIIVTRIYTPLYCIS